MIARSLFASRADSKYILAKIAPITDTTDMIYLYTLDNVYILLTFLALGKSKNKVNIEISTFAKLST